MLTVVSPGRPGVGRAALLVASRSGMRPIVSCATLDEMVKSVELVLAILDLRDPNVKSITEDASGAAARHERSFMRFYVNANDNEKFPPTNDPSFLVELMSRFLSVLIVGTSEASIPGVESATETVLSTAFGRLAAK
jgi:hypothetical protein